MSLCSTIIIDNDDSSRQTNTGKEASSRKISDNRWQKPIETLHTIVYNPLVGIVECGVSSTFKMRMINDDAKHTVHIQQ